MCNNAQQNSSATRTKAKFLKVSQERYESDCKHAQAKDIYQNIKLPCRGTRCSAGYDIFAPYSIDLESGQTVTIATGIRAFMPDNWVLLIMPRSGLGFKYRLRLDNTVGVIDADYAMSDNEGHIFVRLTNEGDKPLHIEQSTAFAQGIFVVYGLTEDDDATAERNGGFGSTDKK